ncbi:MAG: hypothetical protein JO306_13295, partial [Gemmatimonadetes bacterium]|nr:hypothetical protein [Gemmatimonadota bacterium]
MLRLTTLGVIRLERDGAPVAVPQPKRVALLSYLALARPRGFHRRDALLGMFWPELPQDRARNALRQALHQLRAACGEGVLVTRGMHEVGIDFALLDCDVHALEAAAAQGDAEAAASAYGGDLLPGLFAEDAGDWEDWLARERMRLRGLAADAGRALAHAARDTGDASAAARWARWTCALDPLDEASVRWAMELLAACGLRAAALEAYERFAAQMRREFDAEPGPETIAAAQAIRRASASPPRGDGAAQRPAISISPSSTHLRTASDSSARPMSSVAAESPLSPSSTHLRVDDSVRPMTSIAEEAPHPARATVNAPIASGLRRRSRWVAAAAVALLSVLAAAAWRRETAAAPRRERVAVLAFRPAGSGDGDAAMARETAERIRAALAGAGLDVASAELSPGDADAGTVVTGALYRRGRMVEARATVSDAVSGSEVASIAVPLPSGDTAATAALADRVLALVATRADPVFGWVGPTSRPTGSPGYRPFVEGLRALRDERDGEAEARFREAARTDTGFALARLLAGAIAVEGGRTRAADSVAAALAPHRASLAPADRLLLAWLERSAAG